MDLQTAKTNVMQKIMNVSKSSLLEKIGNILDEEMIIGMSLKGANMSNPGQSVQSTMTPGESSPLLTSGCACVARGIRIRPFQGSDRSAFCLLCIRYSSL
ncbi:hypothetical protein [Marinilabilia salmonicolor]|uniref:hypothetical protein n=1 Tax=Marinilabilia salmonicolor TaxID=989 RepID=UPI0019011F5A|nr:hypothetical protein [Marinilabilia salmonicolor]